MNGDLDSRLEEERPMMCITCSFAVVLLFVHEVHLLLTPTASSATSNSFVPLESVGGRDE